MPEGLVPCPGSWADDPLDSGEDDDVYGTKKTIGTIKDENGTSRSMVGA